MGWGGVGLGGNGPGAGCGAVIDFPLESPTFSKKSVCNMQTVEGVLWRFNMKRAVPHIQLVTGQKEESDH